MIQLIKSKTVWLSIILTALSVCQGYIFLIPATPVQQMAVGVAVAVAILLLRMVTTQPISAK